MLNQMKKHNRKETKSKNENPTNICYCHNCIEAEKKLNDILMELNDIKDKYIELLEEKADFANLIR